MRVLITGAAGFAGHHLLEHLLAKTDWELVCLDGLTYAGDYNRLTRDIAGYDPKRVTTLWHDLRSPINDSLNTRIGPIDKVLHLAANSHVDRSIQSPGDFIQANVAITVNLLDWVRQRMHTTYHNSAHTKMDHVIQISTDEVYGPARDGYSHKEWDAIVPSNPYSASKAAQEAVAISYWRTYGVPVTITNTMNLFGERQDPEKFVGLIMTKLLAGEKITVHAKPLTNGDVRKARVIGARLVESDGKIWRPGSRIWLHARNHADALMWLLQHRPPAPYSEITDRPDRFHVAGQVEVDNLTMVEKIAAIMDIEPNYELVDFHSSRPGHDLRYSLDGSKLTMAGWTPPVGFDEALERTVKWTQNALA